MSDVTEAIERDPLSDMFSLILVNDIREVAVAFVSELSQEQASNILVHYNLFSDVLFRTIYDQLKEVM